MPCNALHHRESCMCSIEPYILQTVEFWSSKTLLANRLSQTKFKALNQSIVDQVERVMRDSDRLVQRTRQIRSQYTVLGKRKREDDDTGDNLRFDPEIFDDTDFYQILLQQLIEQDTTTDDGIGT